MAIQEAIQHLSENALMTKELFGKKGDMKNVALLRERLQNLGKRACLDPTSA
jgi:hypothetical protein